MAINIIETMIFEITTFIVLFITVYCDNEIIKKLPKQLMVDQEQVYFNCSAKVDPNHQFLVFLNDVPVSTNPNEAESVYAEQIQSSDSKQEWRITITHDMDLDNQQLSCRIRKIGGSDNESNGSTTTTSGIIVIKQGDFSSELPSQTPDGTSSLLSASGTVLESPEGTPLLSIPTDILSSAISTSKQSVSLEGTPSVSPTKPTDIPSGHDWPLIIGCSILAVVVVCVMIVSCVALPLCINLTIGQRRNRSQQQQQIRSINEGEANGRLFGQALEVAATNENDVYVMEAITTKANDATSSSSSLSHGSDDDNVGRKWWQRW